VILYGLGTTDPFKSGKGRVGNVQGEIHNYKSKPKDGACLNI